ncbi:hypothetical protein PAXRUDRAFT_149283 [Paxillus rubicundulus Ve08.2h10]|uniref:Uncharacterized protein n=1 Tax=Paxillus rubicundulus Ve08.2h10 TaxID=930991 RepID=A0A0D0DYA0_9AGAM|nr:hypothetical protein PAXRUDRAFT_149283 [Paxillus rubicundulus Ve08.2h10]
MLPLCPKCGHSLLMDEIAINEETYYDKGQNCVGGLCHDHAGFVDTKLTDYETIMNASEVVHGNDPDCHYGKEATVGAIVAFSEENYTLLPVLMSTTGDATCWLACHLLFMKGNLKSQASPELYENLSCLPGLNLQVGVNLVTMDFDPKYLMKCE